MRINQSIVYLFYEIVFVHDLQNVDVNSKINKSLLM